MNFIIEKDTLLEELNKISSILPVNAAQTITECILIELKNKKIIITASDTTITHINSFEVEIKEEGICAIKGSTLIQIIKVLPKGKIELKLNNKMLYITSGKIEFNIAVTDDYSNFPKNPNKIEGNEIIIESHTFKKYIEKTVISVSEDHLHPVLNGVFIGINEKSITLVATDSVRLIKMEDENIKINNKDEYKLIIPSSSLKTIINSITNLNEKCYILFEKNYAEFKIGNITIFTRIINGNYPDYQKIIPQSSQMIAIVDKNYLIETIKRTSIVCNPLTKLIKLNFDKNNLTIEAEDSNSSSKSKDILNIDYDGPEINLGFHALKLLSIIKTIESDKLTINMNSNVSPVLIKPFDKDIKYKQVMLLMPINTGN